ncbi:CobW family GTP-binding protein [Luteolibacter algae]|uniref:CobW family GTP-binding protein n=1 Tax=Luteolibacter algae TaxID=454151 RepID=A0ABW5D4J4_9BACT
MIAPTKNITQLRTRKPLILLTGFLGAGKTTFLRALLKSTADFQLHADVILNDYENAHLDSETLRDHAATVEAIAASCACCEGLDFLIDLSVSASTSRNDLLFIELNGTADPLPLLESFTLLEPKLLRQPRWQVCVIDARTFGQSRDHRSICELQLETASHFFLSHTDEISPVERNILYSKIRAINPGASETTPGLLASALSKLSHRLAWTSPPKNSKINDSLFELKAKRHGHLVHQFTGCQILLPEKVRRDDLWAWLAALPKNVIRAKALVSIQNEPDIRRLFERVGTELMADPLEVPISPRVPSSAILIGSDLHPQEIISSAKRILGAECHMP